MALFLSESDVEALLTMDLALDAVEAAHRAHGLGQAVDVPRQRTRLPTASLHILQGALPDDGVFGYKAYTASRAGVRFLVHLFDAQSGVLQAVIEADRLGMMRTGAAGGVAAKWLAREDATEVGVFGAGWQAQSQIEALTRVRRLRRIKVFSRDAAKRQAFCARVDRLFQDFDLLLSPTLPVAGVPVGLDAPAGHAADNPVSWVKYTYPFNLTGQPAASVPVGFTAAGLPVGLQMVARSGVEIDLFGVAAMLEAARPWAHRRPLP